VLDEVRGAPPELAAKLEQLIESLDPAVIELDPEMTALAQSYADFKSLPESKWYDRMHAAAATVAEMDMLVSWNYRHLVNVRRREMINAANRVAGYLRRLEIVTPPEVFDDGV
jgi:hypothetical protein